MWASSFETISWYLCSKGINVPFTPKLSSVSNDFLAQFKGTMSSDVPWKYKSSGSWSDLSDLID